MLSKQEVIVKLKQIMDPELGISIYDLGLIYDIKIEEGNIKVKMTLTSQACPLQNFLTEMVQKGLSEIKGAKNVDVELVFDPPWGSERLSDEAKRFLGVK